MCMVERDRERDLNENASNYIIWKYEKKSGRAKEKGVEIQKE